MANFRKRTKEDNEEILLTSKMKNISKDRIVNKVMTPIWKMQCACMELNGLSHTMTCEKSSIDEEFNISFDPYRGVFSIWNRDFMKIESNIDGNDIVMHCELYNLKTGEVFSDESVANMLEKLSSKKAKNDYGDIDSLLAKAKSHNSQSSNNDTVATKPVEKVEPKKVVVEKTPEEKAIERELKTIDWQKNRLKEQYEKLIPQKDLRNIAYYQIYYIAEVKKMIESLKELGYDYVEEDETFMFDSLEKLSNDFNIIRRMSDEEYKNFCENFFSTDNYDLRNIL